jgi:TPP-dependent pyruvate/acetoin dehydrogenase alpha subunit
MKTTAADFYRRMLRIRRFEEQVLDRFPRGLFYGTTHTYIGQEANAVGVLDWLQEGDIVVSNHRCHGHFLAYGGSMQGLAAELMGRSSGICGGRGGSQHLQWRDFYANGILGGTVPMAVGMGYALKARATDNIVFSFIGDGTLGEGVVYESLNMASLWGLPVLFILENNRYAQSTPVALNLAGDLVARDVPFCAPLQRG